MDLLVADEKSPGLAAALSFILAGLGQMYVGMVARGAAFLLVEVAMTAWYLTTMSLTNLITLPLLISLFVSIAAMADAYSCAKRYNRDNLQTCPRCRAQNPRGTPVCLICRAPFQLYGQPVPPPPR